MTELDLYISLFITFFKIGLFGFGGGYAMLSLIQHDVVETHNWISVADFTDIVAISQSTPGPIAFNTATYIGYTATGSSWGSAICTIAVSLPCSIVIDEQTKLRGLQKLCHLRHSLHRHLQIQNGPDSDDHCSGNCWVHSLLDYKLSLRLNYRREYKQKNRQSAVLYFKAVH